MDIEASPHHPSLGTIQHKDNKSNYKILNIKRAGIKKRGTLRCPFLILNKRTDYFNNTIF